MNTGDNIGETFSKSLFPRTFPCRCPIFAILYRSIRRIRYVKTTTKRPLRYNPEEKRWRYGGADRTNFTAFLSKVVPRVGALPRLDAYAASPVGRHVCTLFPVMILFVMASVAVDEEWPVE